MGASFDAVGASGFLWRFRHNIVHHTYTNVAGVDFDISSSSPFMRTTKKDPWFWFHKYQHMYCWFIYGFLTANWGVGDTTALVTKRYLGNKIPTVTRANIAAFIAAKSMAVVTLVLVPLYAGRNALEIAAGVLIAHYTMSVILAVVFQLAHVVEPANVVYPQTTSMLTEDTWAVHQLKTSADFAPTSRLLNWYLGGLNYQAVHHLFPKICHVRYPVIAPIVAEVAKEFGLTYMVYPSISGAIASHYRVLRGLGQPPEPAVQAVVSSHPPAAEQHAS